MKKFTSILFSFLAVSVFAQTQVDTPTNIGAGEEATSSAQWIVSDNIDISGKLTFDSSNTQYAIIVSDGKMTIKDGGIVNLNSGWGATNTNIFRMGGWNTPKGDLTIEEGGLLITDKVTITGKNSSLVLYSPDAIDTSTTRYVAPSIYFYDTASLSMLGKGDYNFVFNAATNKVVTLNFSKDANFNVLDWDSANSFALNVVDFDETNSILIASTYKTNLYTVEIGKSGDSDALLFYNGEILAKTITVTGVDLSEFSLELSSIDGKNGYVLAMAVPEPAEWAIIFGGIALALAVYRRRK